MAWLFGKKKKEEKKELPELNLPEFEEQDFPIYESTSSEPEHIHPSLRAQELPSIPFYRL